MKTLQKLSVAIFAALLWSSAPAKAASDPLTGFLDGLFYGIEIAAFNGEDHYSAGGEMDYLRRYGDDFSKILFVINIDDAGYPVGNTAWSFYGCPPQLQAKAETIFQGYPGLAPGEPWYQGDHMVFVQGGVPSLAFTAERMYEAMQTVTHTALDTPERVDTDKLVELALALNALVRGV